MSRAVQAMPRVQARAVENERAIHLTHDLPCRHCGHAPHHYLPCDRGCDCRGDRG